MIKTILLIFIIVNTSLNAQTLYSSMEKALNTNPYILANLESYRETTYNLSIATSKYYPTLDLLLSSGIEKTNNDGSKPFSGESLKYYENSLTLMLNIFDGFGMTNNIDYEKARVMSSAYDFINKSNSIAMEVVSTYIEVIKQRELLLIAEENIKINEGTFTKISDLNLLGITSKSEMKKVESSLFLARSNYVSQKNKTKDALSNFEMIINEDMSLNKFVIPKFQYLLPKTFKNASEYSLNHNPLIIISNFNIKASQYLREENKKNYYPKIDLIVEQNLDKNTYGLEDEKNRFRTGVLVSYNLFRGGEDASNIQKSTRKINRLIQIKNQKNREIKRELKVSWDAKEMSEEQLKELKKYKLLSEETLHLFQEEYSLGRRNLLDLLSAQNDLINAKSQIVESTYYNLLSKYRILNSMGLLIKAAMGNEYDYRNKLILVDSK